MGKYRFIPAEESWAIELWTRHGGGQVLKERYKIEAEAFVAAQKEGDKLKGTGVFARAIKIKLNPGAGTWTAKSEDPKPKGSKVDDVYQALLREGHSEESAARIAQVQAQTGEALATGRATKGKSTPSEIYDLAHQLSLTNDMSIKDALSDELEERGFPALSDMLRATRNPQGQGIRMVCMAIMDGGKHWRGWWLGGDRAFQELERMHKSLFSRKSIEDAEEKVQPLPSHIEIKVRVNQRDRKYLIAKDKKTGKEVGYLDLKPTHDLSTWHADMVEVEDGYKRQGIASAMYDFAEQKFKIKITPSSLQSSDGAGFWSSRKSIDDVPNLPGIQKAVIAVDLHGTLGTKLPGNGDPDLQHGGYHDYDPAGYVPQEGAREAMERLRRNGHDVVVWTCWSSNDAKKWLKEYSIPFDMVNEEGPNHGSAKIDADLYIDDKAVHHQGDWDQTLAELAERLVARPSLKSIRVKVVSSTLRKLAQVVIRAPYDTTTNAALSDELESEGYPLLAAAVRNGAQVPTAAAILEPSVHRLWIRNPAYQEVLRLHKSLKSCGSECECEDCAHEKGKPKEIVLQIVKLEEDYIKRMDAEQRKWLKDHDRDPDALRTFSNRTYWLRSQLSRAKTSDDFRRIIGMAYLPWNVDGGSYSEHQALEAIEDKYAKLFQQEALAISDEWVEATGDKSLKVGSKVTTPFGRGTVVRFTGGGARGPSGGIAKRECVVRLDKDAKYGYAGREAGFDLRDVKEKSVDKCSEGPNKGKPGPCPKPGKEPRQTVVRPRSSQPAAGSQFTPEVREQLRKDGVVGSFPPASIPLDKITIFGGSPEDLKFKPLMQWDQPGKGGRISRQYRYTQAFHDRNAAQKFERVLAVEPHLEKVKKILQDTMTDNPNSKEGDGAAIASIIMETGLRPGVMDESVEHGNYGVTSLLDKHVTIKDGKAYFDFPGRGGVRNQAVVSDPATVAYIGQKLRGASGDDKLWSATSFHADDALKDAMKFVGGPKDVKLKDLRTVKAIQVARDITGKYPAPALSGDKKRDVKTIASHILKMSNEVAKALNITAITARDDYIHPEILNQWKSSLTKTTTKTDNSTSSTMRSLTERGLKGMPEKSGTKYEKGLTATQVIDSIVKLFKDAQHDAINEVRSSYYSNEGVTSSLAGSTTLNNRVYRLKRDLQNAHSISDFRQILRLDAQYLSVLEWGGENAGRLVDPIETKYGEHWLQQALQLSDDWHEVTGKSVDKGRGEPCKQGESAARSGCIPASHRPSSKPYGGKPGGRRAQRPGSGPDGEGPERDSGDVEEEASGPSDEGTRRPRTNEGEPVGPEDDQRISRITAKLEGYEKKLRKRGMHAQADWMVEFKSHIESLGVDAALATLGEEKDTRSEEEQVQYVGAYDYYVEGSSKDTKFVKDYLNNAGITLAGPTIDPNLSVISSWSTANLAAEGRQVPEAPGDYIPTDQTVANKLEESKLLPGLESSEDIHKVVGEQVTHFTPDVIKKLDEAYGNGGWIVKSYGEEAYAGFGIFFPQRVAQIKRDAAASMSEARQTLSAKGYKLVKKGTDVVGVRKGGETISIGTEEFSDLPKMMQRATRQAVQASHAANGAPLPSSPVAALRNDYGISFVRNKNGKPIGIVSRDGREISFKDPAYKRIAKQDSGSAGYTIDRAIEADEWRRDGYDIKPKFMVQPAFKALGVTAKERAAGNTWETAREGRVHCVTRGGKASAIPFATLAGRGDDLPVVFQSEDTKAMEKAVEEAINQLPESERAGQMYAPDVMKTKEGWKVLELNPSAVGGGSDWLGKNPFVIDAMVSHLTGREPQHVAFVRGLLEERDIEPNWISQAGQRPRKPAVEPEAEKPEDEKPFGGKESSIRKVPRVTATTAALKQAVQRVFGSAEIGFVTDGYKVRVRVHEEDQNKLRMFKDYALDIGWQCTSIRDHGEGDHDLVFERRSPSRSVTAKVSVGNANHGKIERDAERSGVTLSWVSQYTVNASGPDEAVREFARRWQVLGQIHGGGVEVKNVGTRLSDRLNEIEHLIDGNKWGPLHDYLLDLLGHAPGSDAAVRHEVDLLRNVAGHAEYMDSEDAARNLINELGHKVKNKDLITDEISIKRQLEQVKPQLHDAIFNKRWPELKKLLSRFIPEKANVIAEEFELQDPKNYLTEQLVDNLQEYISKQMVTKEGLADKSKKIASIIMGRIKTPEDLKKLQEMLKELTGKNFKKSSTKAKDIIYHIRDLYLDSMEKAKKELQRQHPDWTDYELFNRAGIKEMADAILDPLLYARDINHFRQLLRAYSTRNHVTGWVRHRDEAEAIERPFGQQWLQLALQLSDDWHEATGKSIDKGKGEPCKRGESAASSGCIPMQKPEGKEDELGGEDEGSVAAGDKPADAGDKETGFIAAGDKEIEDKPEGHNDHEEVKPVDDDHEDVSPTTYSSSIKSFREAPLSWSSVGSLIKDLGHATSEELDREEKEYGVTWVDAASIAATAAVVFFTAGAAAPVVVGAEAGAVAAGATAVATASTVKSAAVSAAKLALQSGSSIKAALSAAASAAMDAFSPAPTTAAGKAASAAAKAAAELVPNLASKVASKVQEHLEQEPEKHMKRQKALPDDIKRWLTQAKPYIVSFIADKKWESLRRFLIELVKNAGHAELAGHTNEIVQEFQRQDPKRALADNLARSLSAYMVKLLAQQAVRQISGKKKKNKGLSDVKQLAAKVAELRSYQDDPAKHAFFDELEQNYPALANLAKDRTTGSQMVAWWITRHLQISPTGWPKAVYDELNQILGKPTVFNLAIVIASIEQIIHRHLGTVPPGLAKILARRIQKKDQPDMHHFCTDIENFMENYVSSHPTGVNFSQRQEYAIGEEVAELAHNYRAAGKKLAMVMNG